ncbi:MAG: hypothetical protein GXP29_08605 [Planctomycetes bacterium]|nr:hypothetical protein [Planctomycetota bacterium]
MISKPMVNRPERLSLKPPLASVAALTFMVATLFGINGCAEGWQDQWGGGGGGNWGAAKWDWGGGGGSSKRELGQVYHAPSKRGADEWTILARECFGSGHRREAEKIAQTLRTSPGIKPDRVYVVHTKRSSRVYYGSYWRPPNKRTGRFDLTQEIRNDLALLKDFTTSGERFFYQAHVLPTPTPDVGNKAWDMSRNRGYYSLRIALFYNEPGFLKRKQAAADYCGELREDGYEAFYRHTDIVTEVFVGSFGRDALVKGRRLGVVANLPGKEVLDLMKKERRFRVELRNLQVYSTPTGGRRTVQLARLFKVDDDPTDFGDDFD